MGEMRFPTALLLGGLVTAFSAMPLGGAAAARLDKEACEALKVEQARLVEAGAKSDMERGPEWAKVNLPPDRLKRIERLLEVEEGLAFRCPQPRPAPVEVEAKGAPAAAPTAKADGPVDSAKPAGVEKKAVVKRKAAGAAEPAGASAAPKPKRAAAKESSNAGAAEPAGGPTPSEASKTSAPPKRKAQRPAANDAYSPPPGTGSTLKLPGGSDTPPWKGE